MLNITHIVRELTTEVTELCNTLHEYPELSLQETGTSARLESYLREHVTYDHLQRVGETGLYLEIQGLKPGPGKRLLIRGDMDALPIQEQEGRPHCSKVPGVMHACGHDVHAATAVGAACALSRCRDEFSGTVGIYLQPAEEVVQGARLLLNDVHTGSLPFDAAMAVHCSPEVDAGSLGVRYGASLASADTFKIVVHGKGGHGAHPHTVIDPVLAAAAIVTQLHTLVSRECNPADSAVVSVCSVHGGTAFNIVPDEVSLLGTVRTINPATRDVLEAAVNRVACSTAESLRTRAEVEYTRGVPPLICENTWVERAIRVGGTLLGEDKVVMLPHPSMGGDDFAFIKERCEGVFVRLGSRTPGGPYGSLHSPGFYCDPAAVPVGMLVICGMALDFFDVSYT